MWADSFTIDVAGALIGVRTSPAIDEAVRAALEPHLRPEIVDAPPNYSLHIAEDDRSFHVLYWGGCTVVRTRDPIRLAAGLAAHLGGHGDDPDLLRLHGTAIARPDGRVALLPSLADVAAVDRRLRAAGCTIVDAPYVEIDRQTLEAVLRPPALAVGVPEALAAVLGRLGAAAEEPVAPNGRRPVAVLALPGPFEAGPSAVLHRLLQFVPLADRAGSLPVLRDLVRRIPAAELDGTPTRTVVAATGV